VHTGWTIGGGLEYALSSAWSAKIEYQHFDFGSKTALLVTPANGNFRFSNDPTAETVKIGVNYHFWHSDKSQALTKNPGASWGFCLRAASSDRGSIRGS
jgi:nucleoside-specific outer membrane channel protein Tsx